jgi:hypothetical protein
MGLSDFLDENWNFLNRQRKRLSEGQARILEYFWNKRRREIRSGLPVDIIYFFEAEPRPEESADMSKTETDLAMMELSQKGYVIRDYDSGGYLLTKDGIVYLKDQHPELIVLLQRLIDSTPAPISIAAGWIAFIAAVFGICDFVMKYILHMS